MFMSHKKLLTLVAVDVRSTLNVGSLLRTSDGLGVYEVYLCGITPYPRVQNDTRLPHIADSLEKRINKTALGAQDSVKWQYAESAVDLLKRLKRQGKRIVALEQHAKSKNISQYKLCDDSVLVVGTEVTGLSKEIIDLCDDIVEIAMYGKKESFNVSVAAAIALYTLLNQ